MPSWFVDPESPVLQTREATVLKTRSATFFHRRAVLLAAALLFPVSLITTTFARAATPPPAVGDSAPDYTWTALDGDKVTLSKQIAKRQVVLIVLRGFPGYQCPICTAQVGELIGKADTFKTLKTQIILVYPGPADGLKAHASEFVQGKGIPSNFTFVLDPDYGFLNRYNLRWNAPHETSYPSTFVIDNKGKIVFAKISHSHGGRAKSAEILAALKPVEETPAKAATTH